MFLWPVNSWLFWVAVALAFALAMRFGLFPAQGANVSRRRIAALLILAAGAVVAVIVLPMYVFAVESGGRPGNPLDMFLIVLSLFLGVLALLVATWALFADSARGRKRCPACWYDMSASPTLTCPECGTMAGSAAALLRTRRRWRVLLASAVLLLLCGASAIGPSVRAGNASRLLPDAAILLLAPHWTRTGSLQAEIDTRLAAPEIERSGVYRDGFLLSLARRYAIRASLRSDNANIQRRGLQIAQLDGSDVAAVVPRLLELASTSPEPVGSGALYLLAVCARDEPAARVAVLEAVESGDPMRIGIAIAGLLPEWPVRPPAPLPRELIDLSRHADWRVRRAAMWYSLQYTDDDNRQALLGRALVDESPVVRCDTLLALASRHEALPVVLDAIEAGLRDADGTVALRAVAALVETWSDEERLWSLVPDVIENSSGPDVAYLIMRMVVECDNRASIEAVLRIARGELHRVSAIQALSMVQHPDEALIDRLRALKDEWESAGHAEDASALEATIRALDARRGPVESTTR